MLLWQVLRSCSSWSAGQDLTEYSIQRALVATIEEAKHYVYIENQFFVSYVKGGSSREHPEQAEVFFKNPLLFSNAMHSKQSTKQFSTKEKFQFQKKNHSNVPGEKWYRQCHIPESGEGNYNSINTRLNCLFRLLNL